MMAAADLGQHKSRGTIIMRGPARFRGLLTVKTTISVCLAFAQVVTRAIGKITNTNAY